MAYEINYDDKRFQDVETKKQEALTENEKIYGDMINQSDKFYQDQINASKEWAETQQKLQQENTDFTIEQIEQQKDKANKEYLKEQSGAYTDWQKQSGKYGANAEQLAAGGLSNTGYSESSQVSMYNTYQSRVATARESYNQAVLSYDNAIKEARLQNNSKLAELAYQALQTQLELALQGFQYKNQLIAEQANRKQTIENTYHQMYQDVLGQINTENALAEQVRQYNKSMAYQKKQDNRNYKLELKKLQEEKRQFNESLKQSRSYSSGSRSSGSYGSSAKNTGGTAAITKQASKAYEVKTDYYQGDLSADAKKYGTFSNGYQPKGISGHGKLSKTGDTLTFNTATLSGQKKTVTQNVWKAEDGTLWYWNGRENEYVQTSNAKSNTKKTKKLTLKDRQAIKSGIYNR